MLELPAGGKPTGLGVAGAHVQERLPEQQQLWWLGVVVGSPRPEVSGWRPGGQGGLREVASREHGRPMGAER